MLAIGSQQDDVADLALGLIIEHFVNVKQEKIVPPEVVDEIEALFEEEEYQEALELCEAQPNFLTNILAAGLPKLNAGFDTMKQIMGEAAAVEATKLHQKISYLALIGNLAPMWGLFGTVYGMIKSFSVLATAGTQVNPAKLADGISHALVVTLFGVAISVPAIFFNAFYRNRITRVCMDVGHIADDLLTQMYHNSKKAPTAAGAPTTSATQPAGR